MTFNYKNIAINYETNELADDCPIIFLHGWEGSIDSFRFFYDRLVKVRKCIILDFPPFGSSSKLVEPLNVKDYADIICSLLEFLGINRVDIVAHSFGGRVAIELANSGSICINKMVLTGCAGIKNKSLKNSFRVAIYKLLKILSKIHLYDKKKLLKFGSDEYQKLSPIMKRTFINIVNYDQTKSLKKIKASTLLVWGSLDKETPFYFTKIFKKNIKDCEVIEFENCSHFAYLEKASLFLNILWSFFVLKT